MNPTAIAIAIATATATACSSPPPPPAGPELLELDLDQGGGRIELDQGGGRIELPARVTSGRAVVAGGELLDLELELAAAPPLDLVVLQLGVQIDLGDQAEIVIRATTAAGDDSERLARGARLQLTPAELQLELAAPARPGTWSVTGVDIAARVR